MDDLGGFSHYFWKHPSRFQQSFGIIWQCITGPRNPPKLKIRTRNWRRKPICIQSQWIQRCSGDVDGFHSLNLWHERTYGVLVFFLAMYVLWFVMKKFWRFDVICAYYDLHIWYVHIYDVWSPGDVDPVITSYINFCPMFRSKLAAMGVGGSFTHPREKQVKFHQWKWPSLSAKSGKCCVWSGVMDGDGHESFWGFVTQVFFGWHW